MRNVNLDLYFTAKINKKNPNALKLLMEHSRSNQRMGLLDFLTTLPVHFNKNYSGRNSLIEGEMWNDRGLIGFVSDNTTDPLPFLQHLSYSHYATLESDLKKINPSYHFTKKSGQTLEDYLLNYKDAIKGMTVKEVLSKIVKMDTPISLKDFTTYFRCVDKHAGNYVLSYFDVPKISALDNVFKEHLDPFPCYSLTNGNNSNEVLLSFVNEKYYLINYGNTFSFETFSKDNVLELSKKIEDIFPTDPTRRRTLYHNPDDIVIGSTSARNWNETIPTTADKVFFHHSIEEDFSFFRNFFNEMYKIKARGKDQLWEKGIEKLNETKPSFDYPFLTNMSTLGEKNVDSERNKEILNIFHSGTNPESIDMFIKLVLMEQKNVIEDSDPISSFYGTVESRNLNTFLMPDYGEVAKKLPSFKDLLETK